MAFTSVSQTRRTVATAPSRETRNTKPKPQLHPDARRACREFDTHVLSCAMCAANTGRLCQRGIFLLSVFQTALSQPEVAL